MSIEAPPTSPDVVVVAGTNVRGVLAALAFAQAIDGDGLRELGMSLFLIPTRRTRWRWLYPIANWRALRLARRLGRRGAVATVPS
jgi:hypothetical protein